MAGRPHVADEIPHRASVGHRGADVEHADGDGFSRELRSRALGMVHSDVSDGWEGSRS